MVETTLSKRDEELVETCMRKLDKRERFADIERKVYKEKKMEAAHILKTIINRRTSSPRGDAEAYKLSQKNNLKIRKNLSIKVFLGLGERVRVKSKYASAGRKRKKKDKRGNNGTGKHLLLELWGFWKKYSPLFVNHVVRAGVACSSYDLAEEELRERGYKINSNQIDRLVQEVGEVVQDSREKISLEAEESLAGKRVLIAVDGGRIRTRQVKRKKRGDKLARYATEWKEPKLLVIQELNEDGKKKKGTKPVYEATMQGLERLEQLLTGLSTNLEIKKAKEIIFLGDGVDWIWSTYEKLCQRLKIKKKSTFIADWYHAVEHITQMAEAHHGLVSEGDKKAWANKLKKCLWAGKFKLFRQKVHEEVIKLDADGKKETANELIKLFNYFEKRRGKMKYAEYRRNKQPLGSGAVESAIRRVVNLRLKSAGTFWSIGNLERILPLRCALMAGRWRTLMDNFTDYHRLKLK